MRDGEQAYRSGFTEHANPHPYDCRSWWMNEAWKQGYLNAQQADEDYDD